MISPSGRAALALDLFPVGVLKWDLLALLHSAEELEQATQERLDQIFSSLSTTRCSHLSAATRDECLEKADAELHRLISLNASLVTLFDGSDAYPVCLRECYRPPIFLEILGDPGILHANCLAIVGSRKPTAEGVRTATDLAGELSRAGLVIVSGLAYGIDKTAHVGCLDAGGKTIAVLGSGIDQIYPSAHENLARTIVDQGGAVVSEFHLGTQPSTYTFPQRNRIISGLSLGTTVVEAAHHSGSLLTATFALEQNREVFAVPGSIYAVQHAGTNKLIQSGAKLIQSARDILDELPAYKEAPRKTYPIDVPLSEQEQSILNILRDGGMSVDLLCQRLSCPTPQLLSALMRLELEGIVIRTAPDTFAAVER